MPGPYDYRLLQEYLKPLKSVGSLDKEGELTPPSAIDDIVRPKPRAPTLQAVGSLPPLSTQLSRFENTGRVTPPEPSTLGDEIDVPVPPAPKQPTPIERNNDVSRMEQNWVNKVNQNVSRRDSLNKREALGGLFHDIGQLTGVMGSPQKTQFDTSFYDKQRGQLDADEQKFIDRRNMVRQRLLDKQADEDRGLAREGMKLQNRKLDADINRDALRMQLELKKILSKSPDYEMELRDYNSPTSARLRKAVLGNKTFQSLFGSADNLSGYEIMEMLKDAGNIAFWQGQVGVGSRNAATNAAEAREKSRSNRSNEFLKHLESRVKAIE